MKKNVFILFVLTSVSLNAQADWERWSAQSISYELPQIDKKDYYLDRSDVMTVSLSVLRNTYYFLISDLDGDNCPFHPSCSNFFVESVKETNILQGAFMFADRFTRDLNLFKKGKYPYYKNGRLYDPVGNYKLLSNEINYIPSNQIVNR